MNASAQLPIPFYVPDAIFPSDNDYGIPLLDVERQMDTVEMPIESWGSRARRHGTGTIHFYTEDYRFRTVWERPEQVLNTGAHCVVEPNYSVYANYPEAVAIYRIYQKRWLARYWQHNGVKVAVDLNVHPDYYELNMIGVPDGWYSYATRGYTDRLEYIDIELEMAEKKAGNDVVFMVYGGGKAVREHACKLAARGVVYVTEHMTAVRNGKK